MLSKHIKYFFGDIFDIERKIKFMSGQFVRFINESRLIRPEPAIITSGRITVYHSNIKLV
jgi:hypothetical protein